MIYDRRLLAKAMEKLSEKKSARAAMLAGHRAEVYKRLPRVEEIDRAMSESTAEAIRAALSGGRDPRTAVESIAEKNLALQKERAAILRNAMIGESYFDEAPECEKCGDTGYIGTEPCECLKKLYFEERRKELSGLLKLGEDTFDKFDLAWYSHTPIRGQKSTEYTAMSLVLDYCRSYADNFSESSGNLLFTGGTGLGKTMLSTCIAKTVFEKGYSVVYDTAVDVFARFESEKFSRAGNTEDVQSDVRRYLTCDLLIIDDLGTEMTTGFVVSSLYYLINTRLMTGKSMIFSTNLSLDALSDKYSPQIVSRLAGEFKKLQFFGKDIRVQKLTQKT